MTINYEPWRHELWCNEEDKRIDTHAAAVIFEIKVMAMEARDAVSGHASFFIRSEAQKKRWKEFKRTNGGSNE